MIVVQVSNTEIIAFKGSQNIKGKANLVCYKLLTSFSAYAVSESTERTYSSLFYGQQRMSFAKLPNVDKILRLRKKRGKK